MTTSSYLKSIHKNPIHQSTDFTNDIILSKVNNYEASSNSGYFSLKIVLEGEENYKVNGNHFSLTRNSFLVVNPESEISLKVSTQNTKGFCLFPCQKMAKDIHKNFTSSHLDLLDNPFEMDKLIGFTEKNHDLKENQTGTYLANQINMMYDAFLRNQDFDTDSFYLTLLEYLIQDQIHIEKVLKALKTSKKSTKEELYRRVDVAKKFIEDNFTEKINLEELSANAYLSKYHFTRSFKSIYNCSPIQYVLQLRLKKAQQLLQKNYSYAEVTDLVGFSDVKNLRRALKQKNVA